VTDRTVEFAKLSGSGNDFICIDARDGWLDDLIADPSRVGHFARTLCNRGMSVGADGVIFACPNEVGDFADVAARFFEADGSETELCGNGVGCFVHWAKENGWFKKCELKILTPAGVVLGSDSDGDYVRACIPDPEDIERGFDLAVCGTTLECDFAVTGIPHVITYVDDLSEADVACLGPRMRHHARFQPRGANANFVQVLGEGHIALRTYEFGVEGETLACGTGSAAAAILSAIRFGWDGEYATGAKPVLVRARSGETLKVSFVRHDDGRITDVCLETIVRFVCRGSLHPDQVARAFDAG